MEGAVGAAGAGAVFGAIGAAGRVVDDPTVVPGAELSATRGPLQGAHINRIANTQTAAMAAIIPPLNPPLRRFRSSLRMSLSSVAAHRINRDNWNGSLPRRGPISRTAAPRCAIVGRRPARQTLDRNIASRIRVVRRRSKHIDEEVVAIGVALSKGLIEAKKGARGNKWQSSSLTTRRQQSARCRDCAEQENGK